MWLILVLSKVSLFSCQLRQWGCGELSGGVALSSHTLSYVHRCGSSTTYNWWEQTKWGKRYGSYEPNIHFIRTCSPSIPSTSHSNMLISSQRRVSKIWPLIGVAHHVPRLYCCYEARERVIDRVPIDTRCVSEFSRYETPYECDRD